MVLLKEQKTVPFLFNPDMKGTLSLFLFIRMQIHVVLSVTHLASSPRAKTNMFPERVPFQKKSGLPKLSRFLLLYLVFGGGTSSIENNLFSTNWLVDFLCIFCICWLKTTFLTYDSNTKKRQSPSMTGEKQLDKFRQRRQETCRSMAKTTHPWPSTWAWVTKRSRVFRIN